MNIEILNAATSILTSEREAIMIDINNIISNHSYIDGAATKLSDKIKQLATIELAISQSNSFLTQLQIANLSKIIQPETTNDPNS